MIKSTHLMRDYMKHICQLENILIKNCWGKEAEYENNSH
ncbi:hypothetical protein Phpb_03900 [Photorhabdus namnaonensis]|uniref:Uncharacterized protein n=1 Tax=Photorhabdus namnaonensis TaxID=1851568 RepID=A0A1B8YCG7_9GAMM|nr:hypothetical protein Phpb_03900 [Photorhabdus namnaonensis]